MEVDFSQFSLDVSKDEMSAIFKALIMYQTQGVTEFDAWWLNRIMQPIIEQNEKNKKRQKTISEARRKAVNVRWEKSRGNTNECQSNTNVCSTHTNVFNTNVGLDNTNVCLNNTNVSNTNECQNGTNVSAEHTNVSAEHTNVSAEHTNVLKLPIYTNNINNNIFNNINSNIDNNNIDIFSEKNEKIEKKSRATKFIPPSVEEVSAYCKERQNNVDPQQFVDHYSARDWRYNGNVKMRDWKAAVRTWERNNFRTPRQVGTTIQNNSPFTKKDPMQAFLEVYGNQVETLNQKNTNVTTDFIQYQPIGN